MAKLTKKAVDDLKAPASGQAFLWDGELKGFGVRITKAGAKTFILQYRNAAGKSRRINIGRYGVMTLENARSEAKIKLGAIAAGEDPADVDDDPDGPITVAALCDWYLSEAESGRLLGRRRRPIKASSLAMDKSRIEAHIKPLLGKRVVSKLKLGDIEGAQADIAAGKTSKPRKGSRGGVTTGGEGVAARTMSTLHAIFEHAVRLGKIDDNPARGVRKIASTPRDRRLSRTEIEKLGKAMLAAEKDGEHPTGLAAIRFLLLTGFRRMEGLGLERAWLDEEEGAIRFPDTKSGAQTRVIGRSAVDLLLAQPRTKSPFFFPADWGDGHFIGLVRVFDRVCARVGLASVTLHTLRHTFASVAADLGFSELTIAALLGHAARGVTQRYIHIDEALKLAADKVADEIATILDQSGSGRRSRRTTHEDRAHASAA
ncbi:integrase arm-type DNA-binding domain-containing protein [Pannonibacter sp. Q-1]